MKLKKDNSKINKFLNSFFILVLMGILLFGLKFLISTRPTPVYKKEIQNFGLHQGPSDYIVDIEWDLNLADVLTLGRELGL